MRRVVITGLGPITAIGVGKKAFWEGLTSGKSGIGPVTRFDPSPFNARSAAEINDWEPEKFFPSQRLKRLDRYAQFAVGSAKLALEDSGLSYGSVATLQSPGDRLAGCSSWHLRFAVYSSGGNLSRRSSCWRWDGTCAFPCRTATSKSCSPSGVCTPTTSRCGDGFSGMRPNCSGAYAAT
jgi:hypothetical protein